MSKYGLIYTLARANTAIENNSSTADPANAPAAKGACKNLNDAAMHQRSHCLCRAMEAPLASAADFPDSHVFYFHRTSPIGIQKQILTRGHAAFVYNMDKGDAIDENANHGSHISLLATQKQIKPNSDRDELGADRCKFGDTSSFC